MYPLIRQKLIALAMILIALGMVTLYTIIRHQGFNLFLFNKISAGVTGILLATVILTGPLSRLYDLFDRLLLYRKWLGIGAFIFAYMHTIITLFLLPERFPASRFHLGNPAFVFGLSSLLVLTVLFIYSFPITITSINRHIWWKLQFWGVRIAFVLGVLHTIVVKLPFWQRWINGGEISLMGTLLPPAGLIITCFMTYAILVRIAEVFGKRIGLVLVSVFTVLLGFSWIGLVVLGVYAAVM